MVRCDAPGCTRFLEVKATRGGPPAWLRNGTAPRGWKTRKVDDKRHDLCPVHALEECLHIKPGNEARGCEVHDWPTDGMAARLVAEMRRTYGRGGVNVCRDCVVRARESLPPRPTTDLVGKGE